MGGLVYKIYLMMKKNITKIVILSLFLSNQILSQHKLTTQEIYLKTSQSTVLIEGNNSIGTGFFVTAYYVLTNSHVLVVRLTE
jgi:hypothetical protein